MYQKYEQKQQQQVLMFLKKALDKKKILERPYMILGWQNTMKPLLIL